MPTIAVDTETTGFYTWKGHRPFLVTVGYEDLDTEIFNLREKESPHLQRLRLLLADPKIEKVFHNAKFDLEMLRVANMKVLGAVHDTVPAYRCCHQTLHRLGLDFLAQKFLGHPCQEDIALEDAKRLVARERKIHKEDVRYDWIPDEVLYPYVEADVKRTMELWQSIQGDLQDVYGVYRQEMKLIPVNTMMEQRGMQVDLDEVSKRLAKENKTKNVLIGKVRAKLSAPNLNLNSPKQLATALGSEIEFSYFKPSGAPKTDVHALRRYGTKTTDLILSYRKHKKLAEYYQGILTNEYKGIIRSNFNSSRDRTGRYASSKINLQNIPDEVREVYVARKGYTFVASDYNQIELRLFAHYAKSQTMIDAYRDERDLHAENATVLFGKSNDVLRKGGKSINFAYIYGMGMRRLQDMVYPFLGVISATQYNEFMLKLRSRYPEAPRLRNELEVELEQEGFFYTAYNRRFPNCAQIKKDCVNYLIQGTAADVLKTAMIRLYPHLVRIGAFMVATIHDEVLIECPLNRVKACIEILKKYMPSYTQPNGEEWAVPLTIEISVGNVWGKMEELK